jgi:hypothetical protein
MTSQENPQMTTGTIDVPIVPGAIGDRDSSAGAKPSGNHGGSLRICRTTGLPVCLVAERFIKLHAVLAVVFLLVGGVAAILLALTRWPAIHLLPAEWYYRVLTLHGLNMLIFWILFFEVAILYFASTTLLNTRLASKGLAWAGLVMMLVGALMVDVTVLRGKADVLRRTHDVLRTPAGRSALLSRNHPGRRGDAHRRFQFFCHALGGEA